MLYTTIESLNKPHELTNQAKVLLMNIIDLAGTNKSVSCYKLIPWCPRTPKDELGFAPLMELEACGLIELNSFLSDSLQAVLTHQSYERNELQVS